MISSRDAERDVIGGIPSAGSLSPAAGRRTLARATAAGLRPEFFTLATCGALVGLLVELDSRGVALDPVTVAGVLEQLTRERLGDLGCVPAVVVDVEVARARLEQLAHEAVGFTRVDHHARLVVVGREAERAA